MPSPALDHQLVLPKLLSHFADEDAYNTVSTERTAIFSIAVQCADESVTRNETPEILSKTIKQNLLRA